METLFKKLGREVGIVLIVTAICLVFILITYLFSYNKLPEKLPLFYSHPWGESEMVFKPQFLILPISLLLITFINVLLILQLHPSQLILKRIIAGSLVFIDLLIFVTAMRILFIFL
jgi:hypothetical protein